MLQGVPQLQGARHHRVRYALPMRSTSPWLTLDGTPPALWERFRQGAARAGESAARSIVSRWQRVRALGADPDTPSEPIDAHGDVRARRDRLGPLLHGLPEVLEQTTRAFAERDFVLLLADHEGVVVEQRGGGGFADEARRVRLIPGSHWSETTRGTNAIGTALAERRPVAVHGAAHWARPNHGLVCYATPICDPAGDIVAVLDATSFIDRADPFARVAVESTARALEERLRAYAYATTRPVSAVERLIDGYVTGAMLVEPSGRVRRANHAARRWLAQSPIWDWVALERAARAGETLPIRAHHGGVLGTARIEPLIDGRDRMLAAVVLAHAPTPRPALVRQERAGPFDTLHGSDPALQATRRLAARLAPTDLPLVLLAETGTGKDLLARALHAASPRRAGPFVALNCGALTAGLLDSELFGYGPGAFTGALKGGRDGHLAAADGGTLFLDEVAEMPAPLQARLLRFLESGTYHRVGEATERRADVRLICATCRDLPAMVAAGTFRADLYYRIRGAALTLPPVRERADISELARALLADLARAEGTGATRFAPAALDAIQSWDWPGNIRELKTALRVARVLSDGDQVDVSHLPPEVQAAVGPAQLPQSHPAPVASEPPPAALPREQALAAVEASAVARALAESGGNVSEAARRLGVARSTLYRMMARHGVDADAG